MAGANNPYGDQENPWENQPKPQNYVQPQAQNPGYTPPQGSSATNPASWNVDSGLGKNWWEVDPNELGWKSWDQGAKKMSQQFTSEDLAKMTNEQRAYASSKYIDNLDKNSDWDDQKRWTQWMHWQDSFDKNCPPDFPYQASDGSGCVEKPDNSNYSDAQLGRPSSGGGGGGGRGGGGRGGTYGNPEIYNYLKGQAMDPSKWLNTFLGQGGMSQYQASVDEQRKQAMMLPEPQRSAALARINEGTMGATRQAAEGARMGMLSGQMMPQEYQYGALAENARQANQANALGWGGLGLQEKLGMGNLGLAQQQFGWESGSKWQDTLAQNQLDRDLQLKLQQSQIDAQKKPWWQKALGAVGGLLGGASDVAQAGGWGKIFSDVRLKENIIPETGALSSLENMPAYSYNYKWDPPGERHLGIMAQDAEKVSPHLVKEVDGFKAVDTYGLLTITMEAVRELNKKLEQKGKS